MQKERVVLTFQNDTVSIKQLVPDDAQYYFDLIDYDRLHLSQFEDTTADKYKTQEDVLNSILTPRNPEKYRFGIWNGDVMVGSNNLTPKDNNRAELGSWVGKRYIGHNYAFRARKLLLEFAFNELGLNEVFSQISFGNAPSKRSVEKSGLKLTETKNDHWVFTLTREEYKNL